MPITFLTDSQQKISPGLNSN